MSTHCGEYLLVHKNYRNVQYNAKIKVHGFDSTKNVTNTHDFKDKEKRRRKQNVTMVKNCVHCMRI